ncbi:MAG TPA: hypothetical protein VLV83_10115 [Acidobacteriota bacterium]|nr:hypothetical protein [Acidobacteriota bacterium]
MNAHGKEGSGGLMDRCAALADGWGRFFAPSGRAVAWLLLTTPAAMLAGLWLGSVWLPLLQAAFFYPLFAGRLFQSRWRSAAGLALAWAAWTAVLAGGLSFWAPDWSGDSILHARAYQEEMFTWVETGRGAEGDIRLFLPQHALHLGLFALLCLVSAGFLGLMLGAALMNYMSFYVGTLLHHALHTDVVLMMAWPPWAMCRVAGFILIACVLSAWTARRTGLAAVDLAPLPGTLAAGLSLIVADVLLKWWLAGYWQPMLKASTQLP